jgi:hypothetical protein
VIGKLGDELLANHSGRAKDSDIHSFH